MPTIALAPITPPPLMARDMDLRANRLPSTRALDGRSLSLAYDDGGTLEMAFADGDVTWQGSTTDGTSVAGKAGCDVVEVRPGLFFVDWVESSEQRCFNNIIDTNTGRALSTWIRVVGGADGVMTDHMRPARVDGGPADYTPIAPTRDLLGKRLVCKYSDEAALEHIYCNSKVVGWQWMISPPELRHEVGLESAVYWKITDQLYLLVSRGDPPMTLLLLMDLQQARNVGRLFGVSSFGTLDRKVGAIITPLGDFTYPDEFQPG